MCRTYDGFPNKRLHLHRVNNVGSGCALFVVRVVICFVVVVVVVIVIMQTTAITPTTPMELITIQIILLTTVLSSISSVI